MQQLTGQYPDCVVVVLLLALGPCAVGRAPQCFAYAHLGIVAHVVVDAHD